MRGTGLPSYNNHTSVDMCNSIGPFHCPALEPPLPHAEYTMSDFVYVVEFEFGDLDIDYFNFGSSTCSDLTCTLIPCRPLRWTYSMFGDSRIRSQIQATDTSTTSQISTSRCSHVMICRSADPFAGHNMCARQFEDQDTIQNSSMKKGT